MNDLLYKLYLQDKKTEKHEKIANVHISAHQISDSFGQNIMNHKLSFLFQINLIIDQLLINSLKMKLINVLLKSRKILHIKSF